MTFENKTWSRNECANAWAALNDAFALERGERVVRRHQTDRWISFLGNPVPST